MSVNSLQLILVVVVVIGHIDFEMVSTKLILLDPCFIL